MRDTSKIEQTPLIRTCATTYSVYFPNLTSLTCRYHGSLAPVSGIFQQSKRSVLLRVLENDFCSAITRSIIHHNDFHVPAAFSGVNENLV